MYWAHSVSREPEVRTLAFGQHVRHGLSLETGAQYSLEIKKWCFPILSFRSSSALLSPPPAPHPAALSPSPTTQNHGQPLRPPGILHGWVPDSRGLSSDTTSSEEPSSCRPQKKARLISLLPVLICFFLWHLPPPITWVFARCLPSSLRRV